MTNSLVDRTNDSTDNTAQPNYSFVRAHDSEVQTVIAEIIKQRIDPDSDGLSPTMDQLTEAFKIYNADQLKTDKEFTQYNIPSTYATILTNKDTLHVCTMVICIQMMVNTWQQSHFITMQLILC